jgi:hypothetical protein
MARWYLKGRYEATGICGNHRGHIDWIGAVHVLLADGRMLATPFHLAQQVYQREPCQRDFFTDLHLHMIGGYVFCGPELFIMGRPVQKDASYQQITDPTYRFEAPDAWLVYLAAGNNLSQFFRYEPYPLPYIGWERGNVLRFYRKERLMRWS